MPALNRRLDLLRRLPRALREAALLSTLPHADEHERDALVAELLALREGASDRAVPPGLLRAWPLLSGEARRALLASVGPALPALLRDLRRSSDARDRAAAVNLAIGALLTEPAGHTGASLILDGDAAGLAPEIDEALACAAERYGEHRLDAVVDAVARVAHAPGPRLRAWLAGADEPGHMALRSAARALPAELVRRRTVAWLGVPALRGVARDTLQRSAPGDGWRPLLRDAHLLRAPSRAGALRSSADAGARLLQTAHDDRSLSVAKARGVVRWTAALPLKPELRGSMLAGFLAAPSALVRLDAAAALAGAAPDPQSDSVLADFAFDEAEPVARFAAGALESAESPSRRGATAPALRRLLRSPHASVRALARDGLADRDPLNETDLSDPLACPVAARRALASEPLELLISMRRAFARGTSADRMRLLGLAARLGVLDRLEAEVLASLGDGDERLASKAALLLGRLHGSTSGRSALRSALESPAPRVRANAVEAFLRVEPWDGRIEGWSRDATARVRANAVRHRVIARREPAGDRLLAEMLGDDRAEHRLSALWVAERARRTTVVNRVADLTRHDDDPRVHARARRCARALLATMRHGWSSPAEAAR